MIYIIYSEVRLQKSQL